MPDSILDLQMMRESLSLARQAGALGEIPVGAIVVYNGPSGPQSSVNSATNLKSQSLSSTPPPKSLPAPGTIIGQGINLREKNADPSAHAEIIAMRQAGQALGYWRLVDCTLYVTLEPCPMCAGAIVNARLPRLVFGCTDPKAGAVSTLYQICSDPRLNHRVAITPGVLAEECAKVLKDFFAQRREK